MSNSRNAPESRELSNQSLKILIVEDQTSDILGPYLLVHHLGFDVTLTFDGEEALHELRRNHYDLVLLDWNMPFVSGPQMLARLERDRSRAIYRYPIKIILYSGESLSWSYFNGSKNYEVLDIWKKPILVSDLSKRLQSFTRSKRGVV